MATSTARHKGQTSVFGRQPAARASAGKKPGVRQNQSILNFFGKADKNDPDGGNAETATLFFDEKTKVTPQKQLNRECLGDAVSPEGSRFNEDDNPVKRRRTSNGADELIVRTPSPGLVSTSEAVIVEVGNAIKQHAAPHSKRRGGFVDDSDDEDVPDMEWAAAPSTLEGIAPDCDRAEVQTASSLMLLKSPEGKIQHVALRRKQPAGGAVPLPSREATSSDFQPGEYADQDDFEDDEFYAEGEEFTERQFMLEQQEMELAFEEDSKSDAATDGPHTRPSRHTIQPSHRFQRAAIGRPAQASPFSHSNSDKSSVSAFARIMSGHAEFAAWAEAAANEAGSRGKMAYQRTCPFYKIMPGFGICVDAFRYGKVEGQNAYFLSHFHSDHYIGLTSSWCHGPIYASRVTCNLMQQQLRVDPAWIVPLEFEQKVEVPNTKGVFVTMIPANHCPGSSLFLFEKVIGKSRDGSPKLTRVLHCGDFRACRAHVAHPLLRPDVVDSITGATRQQVIDTCYLDTTYLTPKYSFPSQQDVISACAQMCVSLSKEIADPTDAWETAVSAATRGAEGVMNRFLESGSAKAEVDDDSDNKHDNSDSKYDNKHDNSDNKHDNSDNKHDNSNIKNDNSDNSDNKRDNGKKSKPRGRLLVVIGTYSIGKERMCVGIARALGSKIYAPPGKMRMCRALEDDELNRLLTPHPLEAQVHMQTLMEIGAESLHDYLSTLKPAFSRVVGFRPTGWNYRPPRPSGKSGNSGRLDNASIRAVLHSEGWKSRFTFKDLLTAVQRGSTSEAKCFGVPYSEHSSFRELTMFVCALRINRVVPTVNVGSAASRDKMKAWIDKWDMEKRKNGLFVWAEDGAGLAGDGELRFTL
ncbi:hypothetical protein DV737_g4062, partial [Chaetothyriales sp. CBS 132003]